MIDFVNSLLGLEIPFWMFITVPAVLVFLILFIIWFVNTRIFKYRLRKIINAQDELQTMTAIKDFEKNYPPNKLMYYSKRMERYSRQMGSQVVQETGLADKWVQKLLTSKLPGKKDLRRVLLYCPAVFVFKAFIAAGKFSSLQKVFINWMKNEGEEKVIRLLAETCRGEDFDPTFGKIFLETHKELLSELTSEAEWYAR